MRLIQLKLQMSYRTGLNGEMDQTLAICQIRNGYSAALEKLNRILDLMNK